MADKEKETWVAKEVEKPVETEPVTTTVKPTKNWLEQIIEFIQKLMNMVLTIAVVSLLVVGIYFSYPMLNPPNFSEMQANLSKDDEMAGEILGEMARTCQNGSKTPRACKLLFYSRLSIKTAEQKQLSQATQHAVVRTAQ